MDLESILNRPLSEEQKRRRRRILMYLASEGGGALGAATAPAGSTEFQQMSSNLFSGETDATGEYYRDMMVGGTAGGNATLTFKDSGAGDATLSIAFSVTTTAADWDAGSYSIPIKVASTTASGTLFVSNVFLQRNGATVDTYGDTAILTAGNTTNVTATFDADSGSAGDILTLFLFIDSTDNLDIGDTITLTLDQVITVPWALDAVTAPDAPVITWDSGPAIDPPEFGYTFDVSLAEGDFLEMRYADNALMTNATYVSTLVSASDVGGMDIIWGDDEDPLDPFGNGTWYVEVRVGPPNWISDWSNQVDETIVSYTTREFATSHAFINSGGQRSFATSRAYIVEVSR